MPKPFSNLQDLVPHPAVISVVRIVVVIAETTVVMIVATIEVMIVVMTETMIVDQEVVIIRTLMVDKKSPSPVRRDRDD
jgi:hypothetical protein